MPATVQPDGTTGFCQASSGNPSTIFSTASRWSCKKPRRMRESASALMPPVACCAVDALLPVSDMHAAFLVGSSQLTTTGAAKLIEGIRLESNDLSVTEGATWCPSCCSC